MTQSFHRDDERAPNERPVDVVAPDAIDVVTAGGVARAPLFASAQWQDSPSTVTRAVIVMHGRLRNADAYFDLTLRAREACGAAGEATLVLVPQFLASADVAAHGCDNRTLHWEWTSWMGGDDAIGPVAASSFDVLDALVGQLTDRNRFPALTSVVIAGHSGGAQVAQRYAVVSNAEALLSAVGIKVRYVIANPSTYLYFDNNRPTGKGTFARFDKHLCANVNDWKYGFERLPRYALAALEGASLSGMEARYARQDVAMLLGTHDNDPAHPALDKSCAAQAQGPHRLGRGRLYFDYLRGRHGENLTHRLTEIEGVGHDGMGMFASPAGLAELFG